LEREDIETTGVETAVRWLWSPKRKSTGGVKPFYESMREVAPGDIVLSFADTRIAAIGVARSHCYECPKSHEFGSVGMNWDDVGWKVEVRFTEADILLMPFQVSALPFRKSSHVNPFTDVHPHSFERRCVGHRGYEQCSRGFESYKAAVKQVIVEMGGSSVTLYFGNWIRKSQFASVDLECRFISGLRLSA
jgi:hypothetical protein